MTLNIIIGICLFTGLVLSLILVQHYINEAGGFAEKWCSKTRGGTNNSSDNSDKCSDILDSRFAKIFGISHADFGILYFSGALLLVLTSKHIPWLVPLLGLLTLGYTIFSIFVQKYVLRQWCTLCLMVQIIIVIQAAIIFSSAKVLSFIPSSATEFFRAIIIFLIPCVLWWFIRQYLVSRNAIKSGQHPLLSAKSLANFRKQKGKIDIEALEGDLVYPAANLTEDSQSKKGKKNSPWRVIVGIAPSCEHCGQFLENMLALIEKDQLPINLRIRFVVMGLDDGHDGINDLTVTESVMALANKEGHAFALEKLRSWYKDFEGKNLAEWQASFRGIEDEERNLAGAYMADNIFWLQEKDVEETPAVFIEEQGIDPKESAYATEILRKLCGAE